MLLYCVNCFYSYPPPLIKRNAVSQSYYVQTKSHTIAVNRFVVNTPLNCVFVLFLLWTEELAAKLQFTQQTILS